MPKRRAPPQGPPPPASAPPTPPPGWVRHLPGPLRRESARPVAAHAGRAPFALGVATIAVLALVVLSGLVLALAWDPERARALLEGRLAVPRAVHAWAASGVLVLVLVHVGRVVLTASYRPPRQRTWWLGLAALAALLALYWLGTALRPDQVGFEAWRHGALTLALFGLGAEDAVLPAAALFWLHVLAVPALLVAMVGLHVRRVRRLDLAPLRADRDATPREAGRRGGAVAETEAKVPFIHHALAGARVAGGVAVVVVVLAALAPPGLGPAPIPELEAARPPWPFAWLVPLQDVMGTAGIPLGLGGLFLLLALVPRIDAGSATRASGRRTVLVLLGAVSVAVLLLGLWALLGPGAVRVVR